MKLTVNVGLHVAAQSRDLTAQQALVALARERISVIWHETFMSDTEMTLVARIELPTAPDERHEASEGDHQALFRVAQRLEQDCIALWNETLQRGLLIGPKASTWGAFNPKMFLRLDGTRLQ